MIESDFLVIGAGIAGASVAHELAAHGRVSLVEQEDVPGYHATGRSASVFDETFGDEPSIRILARASRGFFDRPPPGFADHPLLSPRGTLTVVATSSRVTLEEAGQRFEGLTERLSAERVLSLVPALRRDWVVGGFFEPRSADIDVAALHQGFLRGARQRGATLHTSAAVSRLERDRDRWLAGTSAGDFSAPVVVNAAGAWGDEIARLAGLPGLGLQPRRRSAFTFAVSSSYEIARWPLVSEVGELFYFKPESGHILASPANQDPMPPHDVRPQEIDIALGVERIRACSHLSVDRILRRWAGLRTFAPDRGIVAGFAPGAPGFFWLVGQGGAGIKTSPAAARLASTLITEHRIPEDLAALGLTEPIVSPGPGQV